MHAAIRSQAHKVDALAVLFSVLVSRNNLGIFQDAVVGAGTIDFHKVLINNTSGTNVKVSYLRVTHLSVRQTNVLAASKQLGIRISGGQFLHIRRACGVDCIAFCLVADSPSVENHQQCFSF